MSLPIRTGELFGPLPAGGVRELEARHGNTGLIRVLDALGIAGPLEVVSPWELRDPGGQHLIHAGGYAALPFGELYGPLVTFVQDFLARTRNQALPTQAASSWRAALETNLVALLTRHAPSHSDSQVFFSNSGAEAVEAALKLVRANRPDTPKIVNFSRAYHGKTFGALSLTPNEDYQAAFGSLLGDVLTLPYGDVEALEHLLKQRGRVGAVVVEPVQGEGGVRTPPPEFLPAIGKLAQQHGFLVVADEVQSGLGRCGHDFASLAAGLEPDIVTLAKPLGGGLVPVGATIARRELMGKLLGGLGGKRHSSTFGGGTLAMAVGLKSLEIIEDEGLAERAQVMGRRGLERLRDLAARYPNFFEEVRGAGMLFALQLRPVVPFAGVWPDALGGDTLSQLGSALGLRTLHRHGLHACYTLNSSRTLRLTPALNMPEALFEEMFGRLERAAASPGSRSLLSASPSVLLKLADLALKG